MVEGSASSRTPSLCTLTTRFQEIQTKNQTIDPSKPLLGLLRASQCCILLGEMRLREPSSRGPQAAGSAMHICHMCQLPGQSTRTGQLTLQTASNQASLHRPKTDSEGRPMTWCPSCRYHPHPPCLESLLARNSTTGSRRLP